MKTARTICCLALLARAAAAGAATNAPPEPLTLAGAYALALERSESLQIGEAEWRAAEARYRQAVGALWPEVRAQASALLRDDSGGASREDHEVRAGFGLEWMIFSGFRYVREAGARQAEGAAAELDVARLRQLLYQDVADVFYQVLSDEGRLRAIGDQIEALRQREEETARRVALGRSRRGDLLSSQTQMAEARAAAERVRGQAAATRELLAFLTGLPAEMLAPADAAPLPAPVEVDHYLAQAGGRPDLRAAEARAEAAALEVGAARADRNVAVGLSAGAAPVTEPSDVAAWDLVLQATIPIFDGGVRRARVAERLENQRVSELHLAALSRSAQRDVRFAYRETEAALAEWAALRRALAVAQENCDIQRRDYEMGRASNLDALASLVNLHLLRRDAADLEMRARASMVRLHVAAGGAGP